MWYNSLIKQPESFTYDIYGNNVPVLSMLELDPLNTTNKLITTLPVNQYTMLDEIASRKNIYGDGLEINAYKIFNENVIELSEYNYDLSRLKSIRIPV